jgi:hypothetical protein
VVGRGGLGSITRHSDAVQIACSGTVRRNTISLRVTTNRKATLDLASSPPIQDQEGAAILGRVEVVEK